MVPASAAVGRLHPAIIGFVGALATAAIIGVPTDVISNPVFGRQTPVHAYDVAFLIALSGLTGALAGTYAIAADAGAGPRRVGIGSGVLGWFAVSCPVCNKLVVVLLGTSGATSTFAPMQPVLGAVSVALADGAPAVRVRALRRAACALPSAQVSSPT